MPPALPDEMQPQSLGGLFDAAFDLYKRHFLLLALLVALVFLPLQIVQHALLNLWLRPIAVGYEGVGETPDIGDALAMIVGFSLIGFPPAGVPGLLTLAVLALLSGPVTVAVSDIVLGRQPSIRRAYALARRHLLRLLIAWTLLAASFLLIAIIVFIIMFLVTMLIVAVWAFAFGGDPPDVVGAVLVLLWFLCPYLCGCALLGKFFGLATPLLVLEGQPLSGWPIRNHFLTNRGRFWRAWVALLTLPLFTFGLPFAVLVSLQAALNTLQLGAMSEFLINTTLSVALMLFFQPYWMIFLTLMYYDYRVRGEGLDMFILADSWPRALFPAAPPRIPVSPVVPALPVVLRSRPAPTVPALPTASPAAVAERENEATE